MQGITVSKPQDMSKVWKKAALLFNVYSAEDGDMLKLKLENKYVVIRTVTQQYDKDVITIRAKEFINLITTTYQDIKKYLIENSSEANFDFKNPKVEWTPVISGSDGFIHPTITKKTLIKHIGKPDIVSVDKLRDVNFDAYVVLTMPLVYVDVDAKKVSIPVHVKTIGIAKIEDDLNEIEVAKLSLSN